MQFKSLLFAAAAALVAAQEGETPDLAAALNSTEELSTLNTVLSQYPDILTMLTEASNITIFAPSNDALAPLMEEGSEAAAMAMMPGVIEALLQYHVVNGTLMAENITEATTFLPTMLTNETFANVTGGQRVGVRLMGEQAQVISGLATAANISQADVAVTQGVVHIIDSLLVVPTPASLTAQAVGLTALVGALTFADLAETVDAAEDVTIFAPNNAAFEDIASVLENVTVEDAAAILQYHVVSGTVAYSSLLSDGANVTSMAGGSLNITIADGEVFVNAARVIAADVLIAGGVVHVIDAVLNPNSTLTVDPENDDPRPQFEGAEDGDLAFTSDVPAATSTLATTGRALPSDYTPTQSLGEATETSEDSAPRMTGAVGAAALFAGAAYMAL